MSEAVRLAPDVTARNDAPERLSWDSRARRMVTIYLPLACFLLILLFPFYWMTITAFKPNAELLDYKTSNPFWIRSPTLENIRKLLFDTDYPRWLMTTMEVAVGATAISLVSSVLAAYAIQRLRFRGANYVGLAIYIAYLVPPSILFIPLATMVFQLDLPDLPDPVLHLAADRLFQIDPVRARGMRANRRRQPAADPAPHHAAIGGARADLGRYLRLHLVVERVHLRAGVHLLDREQDRAGRHPHRTGAGRRLSMGLADGRRPARLAAGGDLLFVLRRVLCLQPHRRRERVEFVLI
jgi:hypothetical protein